ncbi:MAG: YicC/YloC family endoribonuclease [Candidatus Borkfalkiaceae bacterium]|nr:YicC/YloC family endoribonuclease [Christensenellaceae bacterium]
MYSMTGFGKAEYKNGYEITVEIKTVNNRFLDVLPKYPKSFVAYDDLIRKNVQSKITRGRVELFFSFSDTRDCEKTVNVDLPLAKAYYDASVKIADYLGIENDFTVGQIMRSPDVIDFSDDSEDDEQALATAIKTVLENALDNLNAMRKTEGDKLKNDLLAHVDEVEKLVSKIEQRAPIVAENFRKRIDERVRNILLATQVDEARLLQEVALFADKSCIDEELTRLKSHISQYRKLMELDTPGRKVDFLVQEFNREANTICSKSNDIEVTNDALLLKGEIEKIREQIQNIE